MKMLKSIFRQISILTLALVLVTVLFGCGKSGEVAVNEDGSPCRVEIAAVGDIVLSQAQLDWAKTADGYDFTPAFASVAKEISGADLALCNLEGNFCGVPYSGENHNYPEALAHAMKATGFDIVQTSNTFSIQNGLSGLESTQKALSDAGLHYVGTRSDEDDSDVVVYEVNGIKLAVIAFTKGVNNVRMPEGTEGCVNLLYKDYDSNYSQVDTDGITAAIERAKDEKPDAIIAMVHWGSEYDSSISTTQEEIEDLLFYNGVDVILGSHSHYAGELRQRTITDNRGKKKDVFVAYSLGDFYSEPESNTSRISLVLRLQLEKYTNGTIGIANVDYTPIYISDAGESTADRFRVVHIRDAIVLYENTYYDSVSQELYEKLLDAEEKLKARLFPEK